jgi:hypothetical protein
MSKRPYVTLEIKTDGASHKVEGLLPHDFAMAMNLLANGDAGNAKDQPHISQLRSAMRAFLGAVRTFEDDRMQVDNGLPISRFEDRSPCPGCWNCDEHIGKAALYGGVGYRYKGPARDHVFGPYEERLTIATPCDGSGLMTRGAA